MNLRVSILVPAFAIVLVVIWLQSPAAHADDQDLYIASYFGGTGEFDAVTGQAVPGFSTIPAGITGVALSDGIVYVSNQNGDDVGAYDATTGQAIADFTQIVGLSAPYGLAVSGTVLYVANVANGSIGEYNATTGQAINANFIKGAGSPFGLAISNGVLYATTSGMDTILAFDASTGQPINGFTSPSGLNNPTGIAISGSTMYVSDNTNPGTVGAFNTATGAAVPGFTAPSGLGSPEDVAVSGNDLYVVQNTGWVISEFDATTGAAVPGYVSPAVQAPQFIAITPVPEPGSYALLATGLCFLGATLRAGRRSA